MSQVTRVSKYDPEWRKRILRKRTFPQTDSECKTSGACGNVLIFLNNFISHPNAAAQSGEKPHREE